MVFYNTRCKNIHNIMMKNLMDFSMGSIAYWAIGFGRLYEDIPKDRSHLKRFRS
ncbi:MAG: hypothetical protein P1P89_21490 [Desulfobacterales bacterium]|nr:hypothetical protein [Desulfobacterales bacterium]